MPPAAGMATTDEASGTTYTSDAGGKPSGKQSVLRYAPAPVVSPDPNTLPEPSIWSKLSTWLILLSVLFVLAALTLKVRRRRAATA